MSAAMSLHRQMKVVAEVTRDTKCEVVNLSFDLVSKIADEVRIIASQFVSPLQLSGKQV